MNVEMTINSLEDIYHISNEFFKQNEKLKVFAFDGEMGVGKTTFIQSLLKSIGVNELQGSPTYSLVNEYFSKEYGKIYHFDVFRLKSEMEAYDMGIDEIFDSNAICFVEWPEKIVNLLPDNTLWVYLRRNENGQRILSYKNDN